MPISAPLPLKFGLKGCSSIPISAPLPLELGLKGGSYADTFIFFVLIDGWSSYLGRN